MKIQYILLVWLGLLSLVHEVAAQEGKNPFEIQGAASDDSLVTEVNSSNNPFLLDDQTGQSDNPFELSAPKKPQGVQGRDDVALGVESKERPHRNFYFLFFTGLLIFVTILFTLFQGILSKYYKAFLNDNILKLMHRQRPIWKGSSLLLYLFFFLNLGVCCAMYLAYRDGPAVALPSLTFKLSVLFIFLLLLKHLILSFLGWVFPVQKESALYNFTIIVFAINLGLFLLPLNLLIAFGPESLKPGIFYLTGAVILAFLAFRALRAIFQTSRLIGRNKFHFFLYLCTIEIAPVFVLLKLATS